MALWDEHTQMAVTKVATMTDTSRTFLENWESLTGIVGENASFSLGAMERAPTRRKDTGNPVLRAYIPAHD